ncbi:MAG: hypothetical protein AAF721_34915 [Myxococcota bacterium]
MSKLLPALLALSVLGGCDKLKGGTDAADAPAGEAAPTPPAAPATPSRAVLKGAIEIPDAVPKGAAGLMVARVPESLFQSVMRADPLGLATGDLATMKTELDEYLRKQLGITITDANSVAAFVIGKQDFGVVLVGVEGVIKGEKVSAHAGVDLYALPGGKTLRLASTDDLLILGSNASVTAAIDAHKAASKSMKGSDELAKLIAASTEGAAVVLALDLGLAPKDLAKQVPSPVAVDRGLVTFGEAGLGVLLQGDKEKLDQLATLIEQGLAKAVEEADRLKARATKGGDPGEVLEGAASILAAHYMRSAKETLKPTVADGQLTISVPIAAGDPAVLAAVAGMAAAIAIPAFTKYMRRSKTSEARVQLAKMFDAASAYFNEEHVARGSLTGTPSLPTMPPHACPNDGTLKGESGITPPLSVDCSAGPGGRCVPATGGSSGPGYYDMKVWDNPVWNGLNFQMEQAHYFHYNFIYENGDSGFGSCQFTAQAFGDLDGDGVFSTYERAGAADENGVNAAAGLYIDQEVE